MTNPAQRHIRPTTVVIAATLFVFSSVSVISRISQVNTSNDFDLIIFTQNWPVTVCLDWEGQGRNHSCTFPYDKAEWTIHGIWPSKLGTKGPGFCDKNTQFSPEAIYGIAADLSQRWTPVEKHKSHFALWKHEWLKHGSCAKVLPPLSSEFLYFSKGLQWNQQYQIGSILSQSNMNPVNSSILLIDLWQAVKRVTGTNPSVNCYVKNGVGYVSEVKICFNKNFELADCDGISTKYSPSLIDCPFKEVFYLPTLPSEPPMKPVPIDTPWVSAWKFVRLLQAAT